METKKRRRTDSSEADEPAPPVRSDIWFDDGYIILQAEDTQFRVYKGTLCNSSTVLKDLVDNMGDSKGIEGCPLLFLSDSAIDAGHVLRTMFHPWSYQDKAPLPFEVISTFLRLGRKYAMEPLYDSALARMTTAFPSTLEEYLKFRLNSAILFNDPSNFNRRLEIVVDTIAISRELGLRHLLPSVFLFMSLDPERLADDDVDLLLAADRKAIILATKPLPRPLRTACADYLFGWLDESVVPSPACSKPKGCGRAKTEYALKLWRPPVGMIMTLVWRSGAEKGLCSQCIAVGKKHTSEGQNRLWEELPSFFDLPPWEELLA